MPPIGFVCIYVKAYVQQQQIGRLVAICKSNADEAYLDHGYGPRFLAALTQLGEAEELLNVVSAIRAQADYVLSL